MSSTWPGTRRQDADAGVRGRACRYRANRHDDAGRVRRPVREVGERLADHVTLHADTILARHFWRDGSTLDLHADPELSAQAVRDFAGAKAEAQFRRFP
jgi:sigma54-dependent transcription regulator